MTTRNFPRTAGVYSRPRVPLPRATPANNERRNSSVTFTANTTWVAPAGTRILSRVTGKGSDGKPESGAHDYVDGYIIYVQYVTYVKADGRLIYGDVTYNGTVEGSPVPSAFEQVDSETASFINYADYTFKYVSIDKGNYSGPTTGSATTGFDQVFPGGPSGKPATITTLLNVQVVAGVSYPIVVPFGGSITFDY